VNPDLKSSYSMSVNRVGASLLGGHSYRLSLEYNPDASKTVRFQLFDVGGVALQGATANSDNCESTNENSALGCHISFDWQERQWFTLTIERIDTGTLAAFIVDTSTNQRMQVGVIALSAELNLVRPVVALRIKSLVSNQSCVQGISPTSMHILPVSVNGEFKSTS